MIVRHRFNPNKKLSKRAIKRLERLKDEPITYDEDCPEYSLEELKRMRQMAIEKRAEQKREVVAIRLKKSTVNKAKELGEGYTGVLARMIEMCMDDPNLLHKCL